MHKSSISQPLKRQLGLLTQKTVGWRTAGESHCQVNRWNSSQQRSKCCCKTSRGEMLQMSWTGSTVPRTWARCSMWRTQRRWQLWRGQHLQSYTWGWRSERQLCRSWKRSHWIHHTCLSCVCGCGCVRTHVCVLEWAFRIIGFGLSLQLTHWEAAFNHLLIYSVPDS